MLADISLLFVQEFWIFVGGKVSLYFLALPFPFYLLNCIFTKPNILLALPCLYLRLLYCGGRGIAEVVVVLGLVYLETLDFHIHKSFRERNHSIP